MCHVILPVFRLLVSKANNITLFYIRAVISVVRDLQKIAKICFSHGNSSIQIAKIKYRKTQKYRQCTKLNPHNLFCHTAVNHFNYKYSFLFWSFKGNTAKTKTSIIRSRVPCYFSMLQINYPVRKTSIF